MASKRGNTFVIFGRAECPWCLKSKNLLEKHNKSYLFVDMENPKTGWTSLDAQGLAKKTPNFTTVPKIFKNEKFIGGYSDLENLMSISF
jgi:glutaredoxin